MHLLTLGKSPFCLFFEEVSKCCSLIFTWQALIKLPEFFFVCLEYFSLSIELCLLFAHIFFPNVENKSCHSNLITVLPMQSRLQDNLILCVAPRCNSVSAKAYGKIMLKWLSVTTSKSFSKALLAKIVSHPVYTACIICPHMNCLHLPVLKYVFSDKWSNKLLLRSPPIFVLSTNCTSEATSL